MWMLYGVCGWFLISIPVALVTGAALRRSANAGRFYVRQRP
jgi:hypothetical protein